MSLILSQPREIMDEQLTMKHPENIPKTSANEILVGNTTSGFMLPDLEIYICKRWMLYLLNQGMT